MPFNKGTVTNTPALNAQSMDRKQFIQGGPHKMFKMFKKKKKNYLATLIRGVYKNVGHFFRIFSSIFSRVSTNVCIC